MAMAFSELPTEIIYNVVVHVIDTSPRTAQALRLTSKFLHEAVEVHRGRRRTVTIDYTQGTYSPDISDPRTFTNTNYLTIEAAAGSGSRPLSDPASLILLIQGIKNLKTLTWNIGPVPTEVLSALAQCHPHCTLRLFKWWRLDENLSQLSNAEIALSEFKGLTHFKYVSTGIDPSYYARRPLLYVWEAFQEIVRATSPLELASFVASQLWNPKDKDEWVGLDENENDGGLVSAWINQAKLRPLKSLTIDCPTFELSSSGLRSINKSIDLSALEFLKFSRGRPQLDYFQNAATLLPNLKHISLNFNNQRDQSLLEAAGQYLRSCSPVQTLSVWGWTSVITIPALVARHGKVLEVLQLHEKEAMWSDGPDYLMTFSDIKLLKRSCPRLMDLTIDINAPNYDSDIGSGDPKTFEMLCVLANREPRLRKLQLYLPSQSLYTRLTEATFLQYQQQPDRLTDTDEEEDIDDGIPSGVEDASQDSGGNDDDNEHGSLPRPSDTDTDSEDYEEDEDYGDGGRAGAADPANDEQQQDQTVTGTVQGRASNSIPQTVHAPYSAPVLEERSIQFRRQHILPIIEPYVVAMWKILYGQDTCGEKLLDVKFGDWETRDSFRSGQHEPRAFCEVVPQDRDDRTGECFVRTKFWSSFSSRGV